MCLEEIISRNGQLLISANRSNEITEVYLLDLAIWRLLVTLTSQLHRGGWSQSHIGVNLREKWEMSKLRLWFFEGA